MSSNLRKSDICCRFGGEEFAILLPNTNLQEAFLTAEKLKSLIAAVPVVFSRDRVISMTASFGVADIGETIDEIINNADQAMYNAKNMGKNLVYTYSSDKTSEHQKKSSEFKSSKCSKVRESLVH